MLAKIVGHCLDPENNCYLPEGKPAAGQPGAIDLTISSLKEMGFSNIAAHQEYQLQRRITVDGQDALLCPSYYHLTPDLREDGQFLIHDADGLDFTVLPHGATLQQELELSVQYIYSQIEMGAYELTLTGHIDDPIWALRRMFFVRQDVETGLGHLVFGDLDHCRIVKTTS